MACPDFSPDTRDLLANRSCHICNNPSCATLTVGPSDAQGKLALKLGEAAHIRAARPGPGQARYDETMTDEQRAHPDNGIWLCASCHTMIDKNRGADFTVEDLIGWKRSNEEIIRSLLYSHRSPLPLLRKFTEEGQIAQDVADALEQHGALFMDSSVEVPQYVALSLDRLRSELLILGRKVRYDSKLKDLIKDLADECRSFMNFTSPSNGNDWHQLEAMRGRIGVLTLRLRNDYGCKIRGHLNQIIPR
jgi:hypothetical protein